MKAKTALIVLALAVAFGIEVRILYALHKPGQEQTRPEPWLRQFQQDGRTLAHP